MKLRILTLAILTSLCLAVPVRASGIKMSKAAQKLLASLPDNLKSQAMMAYDTPQKTNWHFIPKGKRKGLQLREMNDEQQELAMELVTECLSEQGLQKAKGIMSLETTLHQFDGNRRVRDPRRYYFTFFGEPSDKGTWAFSYEGHHLSLNYVVKDGVLVCATPSFFATNPAKVIDNRGAGPKLGSRFLAREEDLAFKLAHSLNKEQLSKALVAAKSPRDMQEGGKAQAQVGKPRGLPISEMTAEQAEVLNSLVVEYIKNVPSELADPWLKKVNADKQLYLAWAGSTKPGEPYSYTVQGEDFVVILYNTQGSPDGARSNHVHAVWRTIGHDFGK